MSGSYMVLLSPLAAFIWYLLLLCRFREMIQNIIGKEKNIMCFYGFRLLLMNNINDFNSTSRRFFLQGRKHSFIVLIYLFHVIISDICCHWTLYMRENHIDCTMYKQYDEMGTFYVTICWVYHRLTRLFTMSGLWSCVLKFVFCMLHIKMEYN